MRIETDDNTVGVVAILALAALLCWASFNARACTAKQNEEITARCKQVVEQKLDPVTINRVCGRVAQ